MSVSCTFDVAVRLVASDGLTVVRELHDHEAGVHLMAPLAQPRFNPLRRRANWGSVHGDVPFGKTRRGTGILVVNLILSGTTQGAVDLLLEALDADLWAEDDYFVETEIEGTTRRYRTDVPSYDLKETTPDDLTRCEYELQLRFTVQPLPAVTITA